MRVIKAANFIFLAYARTFAYQFNFIKSSRIVKNEIGSIWSSLRPWNTGVSLTRIGPNGDGGYLVPNDYTSVEAVFSPGVSDESGFELEMARAGIPCYLADASVDGPSEEHELINFEAKFLGPRDEDKFVRLDTWIASKGMQSSTKLLQMDIEGYEWPVLDTTETSLLQNFKVMVVEFHYLHRLTEPNFRATAKRVIDKILSTHDVLHVHGNNNAPALYVNGKWIPQVIEVTFNLKQGSMKKSPKSLPDVLDQKNSKWLPEVRISF